MTDAEMILRLKKIRKNYSGKDDEALTWAMECIRFKRPHGECNQCRYYEGVHCVQGHAPCSFWGIGGVMWNDYCSRFEKAGEEK